MLAVRRSRVRAAQLVASLNQSEKFRVATRQRYMCCTGGLLFTRIHQGR